MLTNTDFLQVGQSFPPKSEIERLKRYAENKQIFNGDHAAVYDTQLDRIEKVIGARHVFKEIVTLNFQKKISLKTADFLFIEPPVYNATKGDTEVDITQITKGLNDIGYQGAIDCSRYGTSVYKISKDEKGKGKIDISSPEYLFTIVDTDDRKKVKAYVLAWTYTVGDEKKAAKYLKARIDNKGSYQELLFEMKEEKITRLVEDSGVKQTGVDDFLVIPIHNLVTSDSCYGMDDYMDVDSIVSELEVRTAQINKILDAHSSPTVSGSTSALGRDENGQYFFTAGNFYNRGTMESAPLEYITWDANLQANFDQVEKLLNYLSTISEMGAAIFNDEMKTGNIPSGSALQKLYINVLAKVARLRNQFDTGFKQAISVASKMGNGENVEPDEVSIQWKDGLPEDEREEAEIMAIRTANARTISTKRALVKFDGLTKEQAEAEADEIGDEDMTDVL